MNKQKTTIIVASALLSSIAFVSCRKDTKEQTAKENSKHQYAPTGLMKSVNLQNFEPNTMTLGQLTVGYDAADVQYRKAQLYLSRGLAEIVKDSTIAHWITSQTKTAEDNVISFEQVFTQFPGTKQILEAVPDPLGEMDNFTFEQVQNLMNYDNLNIKSSIFLANAQIADPSYKPISVGGFDLDMGDDDNYSSDVVVGWHLNDINVIHKVNVTEPIAQTSVAPILSIDGRALNLAQDVPIISTTSNSSTWKTTSDLPYPNFRVSVIGYSIKERFDASAKSELYVAGLCTDMRGILPGRNFLRHDCIAGIYEPWKSLRDIHRRDLGKWWSNQDSYFCRHGYQRPETWEFGEYKVESSAIPNHKLLVFNTYEHDWFASFKPLSPPAYKVSSAPSVLIAAGVKGRMSKYYEWYLYDPGWTSISLPFTHPVIQLPYPKLGWGYSATVLKGGIEIKTLNWCPTF